MNAIDTLEELSGNLSNLKPAKLGVMAADMIRNHIYQGKGFAALSQTTVSYRGRGRPLMDTGSLRDSITYEVSGDAVSIGTNKLYAPLQNYGGTVHAKKNWLWIPAAGTRQLQRRYGFSAKEVCNGLRANDYYVFRKGRTVCCRKKGASRAKVIFYLKKSVCIPKREFFYISEDEKDMLLEELTDDII